MRRISLALALVGAVAAAGCGGAGNSSSKSGSNPGVPGFAYSVTVRLPTGGTVRSGKMTGSSFAADGMIVCGTAGTACSTNYPWDPALASSVMALQATADSGNIVEGWAGDCGVSNVVDTTSTAAQTCILSGRADKYVLVHFNDPGSVTGHPNWSPTMANSTLHVQAARSFSLQCNRCHGVDWTGVGIAPSCYTCHTQMNVGNYDTFTVTAPGATPASGHFDPAAAPWGNHSGSGWDPACQRCHTNEGFRDYIGQLDGQPNYLSGTFLPDAVLSTNMPGAYATGPLQCKTCHNSVSDPNLSGITRLMFPSGAVVTTDPVNGLCGQCHEARESTVSVNLVVPVNITTVDSQIAASGVSFKNPHYRGAAATLYGSVAQGWAQYPGKIYTGQNQHGVIAGSCTDCHDPHTLVVDPVTKNCGKCHFDETTGQPVTTLAQIEEGRQFGFREVDIDGNGTADGIKAELDGLKGKLLEAMQAYATNVVGQGLCYDGLAYPYFFKHTGTGACATGENVNANQFKKFSARLYRAAYNYKFYDTEFAAWAHNPRYAIEVLFDAITDLNAGLGANAIAFNGVRAFGGHFGGFEPGTATTTGADAFTDWSAAGQIDAACSMCHGGAQGQTNYQAAVAAGITTGPTATVASINAFQCTTCHAPQQGDANFKRMRAIPKIYMPPEKVAAQQTVFDPTSDSTALTIIKDGDRLCMTCHIGREGSLTLEPKLATTSTWSISFTNPHYLGAFGVMMGGTGKMLGQYSGKSYFGKAVFWNKPHGSPHGQSCTACHVPQASGHSFVADPTTTVPVGSFYGAPNTKTCFGCHTGQYAIDWRKTNLQRLADTLYSTIQAYARANNTATVKGVCYNGGAYPYWFKDTDGDGTCSAAESVSANGAKFNPAALRAAFNYKWSQAEPGAWVHNYEYMAEALIDSITDLNGTATLPYDAAFDPGNTTTLIVRP